MYYERADNCISLWHNKLKKALGDDTRETFK